MASRHHRRFASVLRLEPLEDRRLLSTVAPESFDILVNGGAPGHVQIRRRTTGELVTDFQPFGLSYKGGISVAVGYFIPDSVSGSQNDPDFAVAAQNGNPHVKIYNGKAIQAGTFSANPEASLHAAFFAYGTNFNIGTNIAIVSNGSESLPMMVTAPTSGNPHVRVYSLNGFKDGTFQLSTALLAEWFAYQPGFNIGVNIALGNPNGDSFRDVITAPSSGNPHVRIWSGAGFAAGNAPLFTEFFAYGTNFNIGANLAVGDVDFDKHSDLITGATTGNPDVHVYHGKHFANGTFNPANPDASLLTQFFAYETGKNIGVSVAAGVMVKIDVKAWIITAATSGIPFIRPVKGNSTGTIPPALYQVTAEPITSGLTIATHYGFKFG